MENTANERVNMTLNLIARDPGHVFMHVDNDDLATLKDLGLQAGEDESGFYVELTIDVTNEKEVKLIESDDVDPMVARFNQSMFEANTELVHLASEHFWKQMRAEQKVINEQNLETLKQEFSGSNMTVELDESGDFFLDYDHTDNAFAEGNDRIPSTKQMAFSVEDALKIGGRMIEERELKARQAMEDDPSIDYDFVSKGTWNRLSEKLHQSKPFSIGGVNTNNKPRLFAIASEGYGVISEDPLTGKEREAIIAESNRHLEILRSFYMGKGILILDNTELGGVNVGYWHEDAVCDQPRIVRNNATLLSEASARVANWRSRNMYCRSYVEAGAIALKIVREHNSPNRPSTAQSSYSGYPVPPAVRAQQEAMRSASMRA